MSEPEPPRVPYGDPVRDLGGLGTPTSLPRPDTVARLAPGPRPVPAAHRWLAWDLKTFPLVVSGVGLLGGGGFVNALPALGASVMTLAAAVVLFYRIRRARLRWDLLRWGEVATVTGTTVVGGFLRGATSYTNFPLKQARGWQVDWTSYSGSGVTHEVAYTLGGGSGTVRVGGRGYDGGVVLADPRDPRRALCVSEFAGDLSPLPDGQWPSAASRLVWAERGLTAGLGRRAPERAGRGRPGRRRDQHLGRGADLNEPAGRRQA